MAKHTPGPWGIVGQNDLFEHGINDLMIVACQVGPDMPDDDDIYIVNVDGPFGPVKAGEGWEESLANAKLIAAAPDLLRALQSLVGESMPTASDFNAARAAVAKAID